MPIIDANTELGRRASQWLSERELIWLTTVSPDGAPQPTPMWFTWDGASLLMYSQPDAPKLRNIAANSRVSLNFDSAEDGEAFIVISGEAAADPAAAASNQNGAFVSKYAEGLVRIHMTPDSHAAMFSVAIRVTPTRLRGA
ncbi:MAG: TIGR03667 family PPOX class F420-dependent oxidoreductase [Thermomicrobiales bacterium]